MSTYDGKAFIITYQMLMYLMLSDVVEFDMDCKDVLFFYIYVINLQTNTQANQKTQRSIGNADEKAKEKRNEEKLRKRQSISILD